MLNTNIDGKQKVVYALTSIKGIGRRFATAVCKKAEVDIRKRYFAENMWNNCVVLVSSAMKRLID